MRIKSLALVAIVAAAGSSASGQVLWDNMAGTVTAGGGFASQQFEPANVNFHIAAIDNFTLSSNSTITGIDFCNIYYGSGVQGPASNWRVEIYSNPAAALASGTGLVGDVASSGLLAGGQAQAVYPAFNTLPVNINLNAGTYWIGIIAVQAFATNGQNGIQGRSEIQGAASAWQVNPGGGFALPGNAGPINPAADLLFRLKGTVPAPSSLALLGLGGLIAGRRRR